MVTPLKLILLQRGMHQYALAAQLGISETRMSRLASGRATPNDAEAAALANALGIPADALTPTFKTALPSNGTR